MRVTVVTVKVEKAYSDGNYGSQKAGVELTVELEENEDASGVIGYLMTEANDRIYLQHNNSETLAIRQRANPRSRMCNICRGPLGTWDGASHQACEEARRVEDQRIREERYNALKAPVEVADGTDLSDQAVEWLGSHTEWSAKPGEVDLRNDAIEHAADLDELEQERLAEGVTSE